MIERGELIEALDRAEAALQRVRELVSPERFDAADYLHCFADDATGCTPTASKSVHAIADMIESVRAVAAPGAGDIDGIVNGGGDPGVALFALQYGVDPGRFPYPCCAHCPCGTPDGFSMTRDGHDERCEFGCNDSPVGPVTPEDPAKEAK